MTAGGRSFQLTGLERLQHHFEQAMAQPVDARASWLRGACSDDPGTLATLLDMVACAEAEHTGVALRIGELAGELAAPADRSGTLIGRYRLQSRIRWGGMAEVYRAVRDDGQFDQEVALKIARSDRKTMTRDGWFEAERRLLARLRHPHICQIFDGGSADGEPYFVMERIDGEPFLAACLQPEMPWRRVIGHMLDLCSALAHAHRQFIVHRDIKPENVLLADGERVKLLDFGIAATLRPDDEMREGEWTRWYSPGYAAPEISAGETGGVAADIYSLGRLFAALVERAPASQREDLRRICAHATATDPEQRFECVDALANDLRRLRDGLPISLRQNERGYVLRRTLSRRALPLAIGALLLLLTIFGLGREIQLRQVAEDSALQAQVERDRARSVRDFLTSAYEAADPELNGGEDIPIHRLLALQTESLLDDTTMPVAVRADLLLTLGRAFFSLGRHQEADRVLARARREVQGDAAEPLLRARIEVVRAQVARHTGRGEEAGQILQTLLEQEPGWPQDREHVVLRSNLLTTLAALEQSRQHLDLAEGYIRRALALNPDRGNVETVAANRARQRTGDPLWVHSGLLSARAHAALGRAELAQQLLDGAFVKFAPAHADNPRVLGPLHELKADALVELGRHDEGHAAYARALELYDRSVDPAHPARGRCLLQMAMLQAQRLSSGLGPAPIPAMLQEAATILRSSLVDNAPSLAALERMQTLAAR